MNEEENITMEHKLTPVELEILTHYYSRPYPHPNINAPAVRDAIDLFLRKDVLVVDQSLEKDLFVLTEKGEAWLDMILSTPAPRVKKVWVDPRFEEWDI